MFKINLIPEVKLEQQRIKKINLIVTSTATIVAISVGISILLFTLYILGRSAQLSSINKETTRVNNELVKYSELEKTVITLENGLKDIKSIINSGSKWSKLFEELEKVTPSDIQIKNLTITDSQISMDLSGQNVKSIDRFIKSFSTYKVDEKNLFSDVKVSGYSENEDKVVFQAKMNLVGGILW